MRTISEGRHRLSEIATVLERPANSLSPYLETLIDLNLIDRRVPVTEKAPEKSRRGLYFIADNFINFWFRYVHPHRGELELDHDELVLQRLKDTFIESYVSLRYEDICKDIFLWLCQEKNIDFAPSRIGAYWNQKSTVEIDVVAVDIPNKRIFAAECKYLRDNPISIGVYSNLLKKCKNRDFDGYQITYGLFSRTGFDDRLVDLARNNENLLLINENQVLSSLPNHKLAGLSSCLIHSPYSLRDGCTQKLDEANCSFLKKMPASTEIARARPLGFVVLGT